MMNCLVDSLTSTHAVQPLILLVDDDPDCLFLLERSFIRHGFLVHCEQNPILALSSAQVIQPDLVVLDCRMPGMNGIDLCRMFKADRLLQETPVVMMSGLDNTDEARRAMDAGSLAYIHKEVSLTEIPQHLINIMKAHKLLPGEPQG